MNFYRGQKIPRSRIGFDVSILIRGDINLKKKLPALETVEGNIHTPPPLKLRLFSRQLSGDRWCVAKRAPRRHLSARVTSESRFLILRPRVPGAVEALLRNATFFVLRNVAKVRTHILKIRYEDQIYKPSTASVAL